MAYPQAAEGGTASNMEGSCEYIDRGKPTRGGPPTCGLGEELTTPHCENWPCYKMDTCAMGLD
jgi:hypothetical protein